jgi:hypothetical protein
MFRILGNLIVCTLLVIGTILVVLGVSSFDVILIVMAFALLFSSYLLASEFRLNLFKWN